MMRYNELPDDLDNIMRTVSGRRFISNLLEDSGAEEDGYCGDAMANAYWQGRRSVGVAVLKAVRNLLNGLDYEQQMRIEARARLPSAKTDGDEIYDETI